MYLKTLWKIMLCIGSFIFLYLAIVGFWAFFSVSYLLPEFAIGSESSMLTSEQKNILLKIEAPTFYKHAGLDVSSGQGLTTITSSLARNIFLYENQLSDIKGGFQAFYRGVFKCCKKIDLGRDIMALVLHHNISKDHQLQLFVSNSYMGGNNGVQLKGLSAAANSYFGKSLPNLSKTEFITLVAMLKSPNYFHPSKGAEQLRIRVSNIEKILSGSCKPSGWLDTSYKHCAGNT